MVRGNTPEARTVLPLTSAYINIKHRMRAGAIDEDFGFRQESAEKPKAPIQLLFSIAICVLVAHCLLASGLCRWHHAGFTFAFEAGSIAKAIAETNAYASPLGASTGPTAWLSPLYPFVLGVIFKVFGVYTHASALVALVLNAFFAAGTCLVVGLISWLAFRDDLTAASAAVLFALAPPVTLMSATLWDTTVTGLIISACLLVLIMMQQAASSRLACLAGVLGGLLFLSNSASVPFFPICIVAACWRDRAHRIRHIVLALGIAILISIPWMARNFIVMGKVEPRCCVGVEMKLGNNDHVWVYGRSSFIPADHPSNDKGEMAMYRRMGETAYDAASMTAALNYIRADRWRYLILCERRIRDYWFGTFDWTAGLGESHELPDQLIMILYIAAISAIPVLTLIGITGLITGIELPDSRNGIRILGLFLLVYPVPMYLASVNLRLQYPTMIIMIVFGGSTVAWLIRAIRSGMPVPAIVGSVQKQSANLIRSAANGPERVSRYRAQDSRSRHTLPS
jgi:4-amino-4-deoxy-L-arabinose transferase-like glycosyltransferase